MSFVAAVKNKPEKDAFTLAREMVTHISQTEPTRPRDIVTGKDLHEQNWKISVPDGVNTDDKSFQGAITLVEVAVAAALNEPRSGRIHVNYGKGSDGKEYIRLRLDEQKQKIDFPAKQVQAKLDEMREIMSDPKNWKKDDEGNYRHSAVFDSFRPFGFAVQHVSYEFFQAVADDVEIYRPKHSATKKLEDFLAKPPERLMSASGVRLSEEQLAYVSQVLGFRNPTVQVGG